MAKYANPILLILDEWLLMKLSEKEQKDIFELLHRHISIRDVYGLDKSEKQ